MSTLEVLGYLGGVLVFSTFYLKTMIPLRLVAIASNIVYIAYSALAGLVPILVLHALLMPLNIWRLVEVRQLIRRVRASAQSAHAGAGRSGRCAGARPPGRRRRCRGR